MKKEENDKDYHNASDLELKRKLVEVTDAVRKKFNSIKNRHIENQVTLEKIYEPITKPLKTISEAAEANRKLQASVDTPPKRNASRSKAVVDDFSFTEGESSHLLDTPPSSVASKSGSENVPEIVKNYIEGLRADETGFDTTYGIRTDLDSGKLMIGNAEVRFGAKKITIYRNGKKLISCDGNSQLYDLLFLKLPPDVSSKGQGISDENKRLYGEILNASNAAYKNYDVKRGYRNSKLKKFNEVIKPILAYRMMSRSRIGSGLIPTKKLYTHKSVDFVYWNKIEELVDRLRLLWSSKMAGHSGHDNEILSIIEELREEGVIY